MKKKDILAAGLSLALLLTGCDKHEEDIAALREEILALQTRVEQVNRSISALQGIITAVQNQDYVTGVKLAYDQDVKVGYTISFLHGNPITIYDGRDGANGKDGADGKDGKDADGPKVGIKQDTDGVWYWTIDGKWIVDDYNRKFPVYGDDATTPLLVYRSDGWYISYDDGRTYQFLSSIAGSVDTVFKSIQTYSEYYRVVMTDGTVIQLKRYVSPSISFDKGYEQSVEAGSTLVIAYSVVATSTDFQIGTHTTGGLDAQVSRTATYGGNITVKVPSGFKSGEVAVFFSACGNVINETFKLKVK